MTAEEPEIGMVIRHVYLWRNEALRGHEEGRKARPCVIIHKQRNDNGRTEVYVAPITHTKPRDLSKAKEIPPEAKERLGLDHEKSWIILNDINQFTWIGPDIRPTPSGEFAYGYLPPGLTKKTIEQIRDLARQKEIAVTDRDEDVKKRPGRY